MRLGKSAALLAGAAALSLAGCQWLGMEKTAPARSTLEDNMFLAAALARVDSQLDLARMAGEKAKTASLVAYAKGVASERAGLQERLAAAAKADGVGRDTRKAPRLDDFAPPQGEAFERAYVAAQIEDQQNNLDSFVFEAENGTNPALKSLAAAEVPRLKQDLAAAAAIVKDLPFEAESNTANLANPATGRTNPLSGYGMGSPAPPPGVRVNRGL